MNGIVDLFMIYMFLKRLVTPFDKTKAFELGLIDAEGKRLKKASTPEEKAALGYFDKLVFNLKRLLGTIPGGKSRIASYAAALLLLREQDERLVNDSKYLREEFQKTLSTIDMNLFEEVMTSVGSGAFAGTGGDEPPVRKRKQILRRRMQ